MHIYFRDVFKKQLKKQSDSVREKFYSRLGVFKENPFSPELNNHSLSGKYMGCRSINVTGDIRAIYTVSDGMVWFMLIGSHSELYG